MNEKKYEKSVETKVIGFVDLRSWTSRISSIDILKYYTNSFTLKLISKLFVAMAFVLLDKGNIR